MAGTAAGVKRTPSNGVILPAAAAPILEADGFRWVKSVRRRQGIVEPAQDFPGDRGEIEGARLLDRDPIGIEQLLRSGPHRLVEIGRGAGVGKEEARVEAGGQAGRGDSQGK